VSGEWFIGAMSDLADFADSCVGQWIGTTCPGEHRENCGCPGTPGFRHRANCQCFAPRVEVQETCYACNGSGVVTRRMRP
jgi:hypothetical protein